MPRIRSLKPDIWQDEKVGALQPLARLMWIGLITQADDDGRLWYRPRILRVAIFPYDDKIKDSHVEGLLKELVRSCLLVIYKTEDDRRALQIKKWTSHQKINRPVPSSIPAPPEDSLSTHGGLTEDSLWDGNGMDRNGMDKDTIKSASQDSAFDDDFDVWWQGYPRKVGKVKTRDFYDKLRKEGVPADLLSDARDAYARELKENETELKYVMHPEKFLGRGGYFADYASMKGWEGK